MVNPMNINYESYRIFYTTAKYQSFTQAASVLGNSQPNITRAMKKLESDLGCKLFLRSNQGVRLTPEGQRLYAHVALAVEHLRAGEDELTSRQGLQSGLVTVATSELGLRCCLLPVLKAYRARYPGIHIRVSNYSAPQAIAVLRDGLADFAVVTVPRQMPKALLSRRLMEIQEVPVVGTAFAALAGQPLDLETLAGYPLVSLGPQTVTFAFYSQLFSDRGLTFQPDIEAATADQILPLVRSDLGIGFVPETFAREEPGVMTLDLYPPVPRRTLFLLKRARETLSAAAKELERMLAAQA